MWQAAISKPNSSVTISGVLSAVLVMSLVCSMSMRHGHADAPIANTAEQAQPLQAGQNAPLFTVRTVDNEAFVFDPRNLERPAVLITFRGGWCPFCNMHLSELKDVVAEIDSLGVDVLFLSGDRPELLYQSLSRETQEDIAGLNYTILSDADAQAAIALGIAFKASQQTIDRRLEKQEDIDDSSMLRHGVLPVPAVFAVGTDGVIAFTFADPNYKVRLPSDELMTVVKELVQ
jgi:peroxiredoxin